MDWERVEQYVLRCPLQELVFRTDGEVYILGNDPTRPAWWHVRHEVIGVYLLETCERRGFKDILTLIEHRYPEFYAWLLCRFSEE
ncbi:MAG TPA: hypothetical protein VFA09_01335 [Ktedonobacteraceae bacterium]|nr:hypothetical protein [Ktedonobacteraceae bacterium]